jgi:hypothetical protein
MGYTPSPLGGCVAITKCMLCLYVMLDSIRHPEEYHFEKILDYGCASKRPGQARNDKT